MTTAVLTLMLAVLSVASAQQPPQKDTFTFDVNRLNNSMAQIEVGCVGTPKVTIGKKTIAKASFAHKFETGTHTISVNCGIRNETRTFVSAGEFWPAAGLKSGILNAKVDKGHIVDAQFTVIGTCEPFELSWGDTSEPLVFEGIDVSSVGATCLSDVVTKKAQHTYTANGDYQLTLKAGNKTSSAKVKITKAVRK